MWGLERLGIKLRLEKGWEGQRNDCQRHSLGLGKGEKMVCSSLGLGLGNKEDGECLEEVNETNWLFKVKTHENKANLRADSSPWIPEVYWSCLFKLNPLNFEWSTQVQWCHINRGAGTSGFHAVKNKNILEWNKTNHNSSQTHPNLVLWLWEEEKVWSVLIAQLLGVWTSLSQSVSQLSC